MAHALRRASPQIRQPLKFTFDTKDARQAHYTRSNVRIPSRPSPSTPASTPTPTITSSSTIKLTSTSTPPVLSASTTPTSSKPITRHPSIASHPSTSASARNATPSKYLNSRYSSALTPADTRPSLSTASASVQQAEDEQIDHSLRVTDLLRLKGRARSCFVGVNRYLRATNFQAARAGTHYILNKERRVPTIIRPLFYQHCVQMFLNAGDWEGANGLYNRMKAEALPGRPLVLAMLLEYTVKRTFSPDDIDAVIRDSPNLDKVTELEFQAALRHLVHSKVNVYVLERFFEKYGAKMSKDGDEWEPSYRACAIMAQAYAQNGRDLEAEKWLKRARARTAQLLPNVQKQQKADSEVFTRFLVGSATFNHNRWKFFRDFWLVMRDEKIPMTTQIHNIFIQYFSLTGRADAAYLAYRNMKPTVQIKKGHSVGEKKNRNAAQPNTRTFQYLFNARSSQVKHFRSLREVGGGRGIFREMVELQINNTNHRPQSRHGVITVEVLNAALRHFVRKHDYAAATVALRTFPICKIPPNRFTATGIVHNLVARVARELQARSVDVGHMQNAKTGQIGKIDQTLWVDRMLGEVIKFVDNILMGSDWITKKLLKLVGIDPRKWVSKSLDVVVLIRPLLELLRRALIANFSLWPGENPATEDKVLATAMEQANVQMLPPANPTKYSGSSTDSTPSTNSPKSTELNRRKRSKRSRPQEDWAKRVIGGYHGDLRLATQ